MSFNIVDLVKDQISGSLMGQMGSMLGNESSLAAGAVDNAVPALLEGLRNSTSTTDGADSLFQAVQDQDDSLLDNLGDMLGGGQGSSVIDNGTSMLGTLFGSGGLGSLGGVLSAVSGLSKGGSGSLLGMLAPIVVGVLKRKVMGNGLNAGGLASMLMGQKDNIGGSMPVGLTDQMSSSGFLSSISGGLGSVGSGISSGAGAVTGTVAGAGAVAAGAAGSVADGAGNLASGAVDAAGNAVGGVRDAVDGVAGSVGDAAGNAADAAGNAVSGATDAASNAIGGATDAAGNAIGGATDAAGNAIGGVTDAAGNAVGGVTDAAGNAIGGATDAAGNVVDGARDAAGNAVDGVRDAAGNAVDSVGDAASSTAHAAGEAGHDASAGGGGWLKKLIPLVLLLALGWLGLKFFGGSAEEELSDAGTATETATTAAAGSIDTGAVGDEVNGFFTNATETFGGITDEASATAALPQLEEMSTNLGGLNDKFQQIPEAARGPVTDIVGKGMENLGPIVDKVKELPGVGGILEPVLGPMMEMLKGMGGS